MAKMMYREVWFAQENGWNMYGEMRIWMIQNKVLWYIFFFSKLYIRHAEDSLLLAMYDPPACKNVEVETK